MMNLLRYETMTEAYHGLNMFFTKFTQGDPGAVTHNNFRNDHFLNAFNLVVQVHSPKNELRLEDLGYSKVKSTHLIKSYIDKGEFWNWIARIEKAYNDREAIDSDVVMRTTENSKHTNGPCILSMSFRFHRKPHLTVISRSVELPQIFGGDTLLVSAVAQILGEVLGLDEPVRTTWFISSARIKSRAANFYRLLVYPFELRYLNKNFQAHIDKQWNNILADQEKKVTFSKLVKLQQEYKRVVIDRRQPNTQSGVETFIHKLKEEPK